MRASPETHDSAPSGNGGTAVATCQQRAVRVSGADRPCSRGVFTTVSIPPRTGTTLALATDRMLNGPPLGVCGPFSKAIPQKEERYRWRAPARAPS
jgi:hypothetical protein